MPQLGMSQAGFEAELRSDMAKAQLRAGISGSEFVLREEAQRVEQLTQQTRTSATRLFQPASSRKSLVRVTVKL